MSYRVYLCFDPMDQRTASWFSDKLTAFRTPRALLGSIGQHGPIPRRVSSVSTNHDDIPAGSILAEADKLELDKSDVLIVLCSPHASTNMWIDKRIEYWLGAKGPNRIIPVVVDGDNEYAWEILPARLQRLERKDDDGAVYEDYLAIADARNFTIGRGSWRRQIGQGKNQALLSVLAGIFGVKLNSFRKRISFTEPARSSVFISYRRADSGPQAAILYRALVKKFGDKQVFLDVDKIPVGIPFPDYIRYALQKSKVMIVVIGTNWTQGARIFEKDDPVRQELEMARAMEVPILPVLIETATMPRKDALPESLIWLTDVNAQTIVKFHPEAMRLLAKEVARAGRR